VSRGPDFAVFTNLGAAWWLRERVKERLRKVGEKVGHTQFEKTEIGHCRAPVIMVSKDEGRCRILHKISGNR